MKIAFAFQAQVVEASSGVAVHLLTLPDVLKLSEDKLEHYLDADIADKGVIGGEIYLEPTSLQVILKVYFWTPNSPDNELITSLCAFTIAQLDDGVGEGGFEFTSDGKQLLAIADTDSTPHIEVNDDGRIILGSRTIAIAARDGDLSRLAAALNAEPNGIDKLHQGCTPLQLAILYGHPHIVRRLLEAGANPNHVDSQGLTALETCALANALDDQESRDIASMLLKWGADPHHVAPGGESARSFAESRKKMLLASVL